MEWHTINNPLEARLQKGLAIVVDVTERLWTRVTLCADDGSPQLAVEYPTRIAEQLRWMVPAPPDKKPKWRVSGSVGAATISPQSFDSKEEAQRWRNEICNIFVYPVAARNDIIIALVT